MSPALVTFVEPPSAPKAAPAQHVRRLYIPQLDVLRFYAFLSVFFFHALPTNVVALHTGRSRILSLAEATIHHSCDSGVPLFFLLSAYLIAELLRREKSISGDIHLRMFYIRRALRIWPLYYLAVGIGVIISLCPIQYPLTWIDLLTYVTFLKNWDVVLRGWNWNPIYILWTVSAEEQFYLVWPLAQKLLNRRQLLLLCSATIVLLPILVFWPTGVLVRNQVTSLMFLFIYFPLGGILSFALDGKKRSAGAVGCLGLLLTGATLWLLGNYVIYPGGDHEGTISMMLAGRLIVMVGTVLTFLAFLWSDPRWAPRPLIYLGKISYGLYVFHVMMLQLVSNLIGHFGGASQGKLIHIGSSIMLSMTLTIGAAMISYESLEKRFLRLKDRFTIVPSRAA